MKRYKNYLRESKKIIAYHASNKPIKVFNPKMGAQGVIWFSTDKDSLLAGNKGAASRDYLMTVELTLNKIAGWSEYDKLGLGQIHDMGFNAIKLDDDYIMFNPKDIKILKREKLK